MLLRRLERQKAILLLGPEAVMGGADNPTPVHDALQAYIQDDLEDLLEEQELKNRCLNKACQFKSHLLLKLFRHERAP